MAALSGRRRGGYEPWPGYVDALSTLLMVIIFVLLVFVLAQGFLSVALSGRDQALARLNRQVAELSDLLALERGSAEELRLSVARLSSDLAQMTAARDALTRELATLAGERDRAGAERSAALAERERLAAQLAEAQARAEAATARSQRLEAQLAEALTRADQTQTIADARARDAADAAREAAERQRAATEAARALADARRELAETRRTLEEERAQLARMREEIAALDRQVTADRATIELRLSEIARLAGQVQALTALRDELERQAAAAAARAATEEQQRRAFASLLEEERRLGETARAQVALLNRQIEELRAQIARIAAALEAAEAEGRDKDAQIAALGQRLNLALAARVEELQRYRSEFFGRLRDVLGNRPGITVVGDRFVFQSEVLFPVGSADLQPEGVEQIRQLAGVIREIARDIPPDVPWILRVDGHADRTPISGTGRFTTNWELSAARAITVVRLLALLGVPENRLAATGFGEFQPLDPGDSPAALARNRRIELRLTDR